MQKMFGSVKKALGVESKKSRPATIPKATYSADDYKHIDIEEVQRILVSEYTKIETAKGSSNVLVVGNTGAGKSTLVNYLLGETIICVQDHHGNDRLVVDNSRGSELDEMLFAPIGHEGSCTLHAQTFSRPGYRRSFTDCPGFFGIRSIEQRVVESVGTELAIRMSKSISGIVVVVDFRDIDNERSSLLLQLCKTLLSLLANPDQTLNSVLWVVSHRPIHDSRNEEQLLKVVRGKLSQKVETFGSKTAQEYTDTAGLSGGDYSMLEQIFQHVLDNFDRLVVLPHLLDSGGSRTRIMQKLDEINLNIQEHTSLTIDQVFLFNEYDPYRKNYNDALIDLANHARLIMQASSKTADGMTKCHDQAASSQRDVVEFDRQKLAVSTATDGGHLKQQQLDTYTKSIRANDVTIHLKTEAIDRKTKERQAHQARKDVFDTADPIMHWRKDDSEFKVKSQWFGRVREDFEYPHKEEIVDVDLRAGGKGTFEDVKGGAGTDTWTAIFVSHLTGKTFGDRAVGVTVYIAKRNTKDAKASIAFHSEQITAIGDEITAIEEEKSELVSENQRHQGLIISLKTDVLSLGQAQENAIKEIERSIVNARASILQADKKKEELRKYLSKLKKDFDFKRKSYDLVLEVSSYLKLPSVVVGTFKEEYPRFIESYEGIFSATGGYVQEATSSISEIPQAFFCHFSKKKMNDPVIVECCGSNYDRSSLSKLKKLKEGDNEYECTNPSCRSKVIVLSHVTPNVALRDLIHAADQKAHSETGYRQSIFLSAKRMGVTDVEAALQVITKKIQAIDLEKEGFIAEQRRLEARLRYLSEKKSVGMDNDSEEELDSFEKQDGTNILPFEKFMTAWSQEFEDEALKAVLRTSKQEFQQTNGKQFSRLVAGYGLSLKNVPGDGNCFFHALLDQLQSRCPQVLSSLDVIVQAHTDLRQFAVTSLIRATTQGELDFMLEEMDRYIADMAADRTWADGVVIPVIAKALGITIVLINSDGNKPTCINGGAPHTVYLGYQVGLHFQSVNGEPTKKIARAPSTSNAEPKASLTTPVSMLFVPHQSDGVDKNPKGKHQKKHK